MEFKFRMCVILTDPTPRQKLLIARLLRDSDFPVIAMDEHNASVQDLREKSEKLVIFRPFSGSCPNQADYMQRLKNMGWTRDRVLVESVDFPEGEIPGDHVTQHIQEVKAAESSEDILRSDEEWEMMSREGIPLPTRIVGSFGDD